MADQCDSRNYVSSMKFSSLAKECGQLCCIYAAVPKFQKKLGSTQLLAQLRTVKLLLNVVHIERRSKRTTIRLCWRMP